MIILLSAIFFTGCQTNLDIRHTELVRKWGEGNRAFAKSIDEYVKVVDSIATKYHQKQRELRDAKWEFWLSQQTDDDGALVYMADDETVKPMLTEQMRSAIASRDQASDIILESERTWDAADAKIKRAIEDFTKMNEVALGTNEDIAEAKKSAQQFINSALDALAGLATGLGISGL